MEKINFNKKSNIKFDGVPKKDMNIEELLKKSLKKIHSRAEREVPEFGDFKTVEETFENSDKSISATNYSITITKTPKNIENNEKLRDVVITAYSNPSVYKAQRLIAVGEKEDILKKLTSKEFLQEIKEAAQSLSKSLEDA